MRLVDGHKAKAGYRCTVTGREAHSAYPALGANAVVAAARIIAAWRNSARGSRRTGRSRPGSTRRTTPRASAGSRAARSSTSSPTTAASSSSSAPCRARTRYASCARSRRSRRNEILPRLRATAPDADIEFEEVLAYPGMTPPSESDFTRLLHELTGTREPAKVAFGTDGGCFAARGIPTLICGPGDIKVAHKPDEWIARRAARAVRRISARARAWCPDVELRAPPRHGTAGPLVRNVTRRPRHRRYLGVRHLTVEAGMDSTPRRPELPVGPPRAATVTASPTRHPQRRSSRRSSLPTSPATSG